MPDDKFDVEKAFEELNAKIDRLAPADEPEADDAGDGDDTGDGDDFDARTAFDDLTSKVDRLLAQPRTRQVQTKRAVPAPPARRAPTRKPSPNSELAADPGKKRRRGWFPES